MSRRGIIAALRWVAVIPAALLGWYLALVIGLSLRSLATSLCPPEDLVSDACAASWFAPVEDGIFIATAALAALLVLLFSTVICPSHKRGVAVVVFVVGTASAVLLGYALSIWLPPLAAVISGLFTLRQLDQNSGEF